MDLTKLYSKVLNYRHQMYCYVKKICFWYRNNTLHCKVSHWEIYFRIVMWNDITQIRGVTRKKVVRNTFGSDWFRHPFWQKSIEPSSNSYLDIIQWMFRFFNCSFFLRAINAFIAGKNNEAPTYMQNKCLISCSVCKKYFNV